MTSHSRALKAPFSNRDKSLVLLILMAITAILVGSITLFVLYKAAFTSQEARLEEIAQSQASLIESFAREYMSGRTDKNEVILNIIPMLQEAHSSFHNFGRTGEYTLAKLEHNNIIFLSSTRLHQVNQLKPIPINSPLASPMREALLGHSGVMIGIDYRGKQVLAAYAPIGTYHLGIVAKIDMAEVHAPFIGAGLIAIGVSTTMLLIALWLFSRISNSMIEAAEQDKSRLDVILDTVVDGVVTINEKGMITSFNSAAENIFGYKSTEAIGSHVNLLIPQGYHEKHNAHLKSYMTDKTSEILGVNREVTGQRKDGTTFPMDLAVGNAQLGKVTCFTAIVRDITDRKQSEQELQLYRDKLEQQVRQRTTALEKANEELNRLARRDSLTGIANRRVFDEVLVRELRRATRDQAPLTLIMCDIDYFKNYNDRYGHLAGDSCLIKVAKIIYQQFHRAGDLVSRYGGEEFAIILPNTSTKEAQQMAEVLRETIWDLDIEHKSSLITDRITISCGIVSVVPRNNLIAKTLIKTADDALYLAKEQGRNRVILSNVSTTHDLSAVVGD